MGKIVAVVNQKGGVGKTTTAVNLTAALHALGLKVLLCDFDPQANATSGLGLDKRKIKYSAYDVTINEVGAAQAIVSTEYGYLLPSSSDLAGAAVELINQPHRELALEKALHSVRDQYDIIFIDCPPSLELLTLNGLCAADSILVPVQCEYFALEGLSDLMATLRMVKKRLNPRLEIFYSNLVAVNYLSLEVAVDFVKVEAVVTRDKRLCLEDVLTEFVDIACCTREVASGLYAARHCASLHLEALYVVCLPAMEGEVEVLKLLEYLLCVNANLSITLLGNLVSFPYQFFFHNGMCFIVFECR